MVDIDSAGGGNWATGATWVGGVAPGNNDRGVIKTGHAVTVAAAAQAMGFVIEGGSLILNADFTFTDVSGCGFLIRETNSGGFSSNGSPTTPRILKSASSNPTNKWIPTVWEVSGADARVLDFDFCQFQGNRCVLCNQDYSIFFNDAAAGNYIATETPLNREPKIVDHFIEGRSRSRIKHTGGHAGTVTIGGHLIWTNDEHIKIKNFIASKKRVSYMGMNAFMPKCRIERVSYQPRAGSLILPFTMTLVEDD